MENTQSEKVEPVSGLWRAFAAVLHWRRFIVFSTMVMAVLSVVIALVLPKWYLGTTRLLLPEGSGSSLASALMGDLSSAARSLLGGGGDYVRYLAILTSRTVSIDVVDEYDLVRVYDLEDSETPLDDAIEELSDNVDFTIDDEFDFLTIEVLDRDPQRAADMANFFVARLNAINSALSSQAATGLLDYVEVRYAQAEDDLAALLDSLQSYQARYGIFDIEAQTSAYFEQVASLRRSVLEVEIQYEALKQQLGPQNQRVVGLQQIVRAANRKYQAALDGKEKVLPVASKAMPQAARDYAELMLERTIQERIMEFLAPMLEQARFEERREVQAVQVVDTAIPPLKKARPLRTLIVIGVTFSAFVLSIVFALLMEWWRTRHQFVADQLARALANKP